MNAETYKREAAAGALDRRAGASSGTATGLTARSGTTAATAQPSEVAIAAIRTLTATVQSAPTDGFTRVAVGTRGANTTGVYAKVLTAIGLQGVSVALSRAARWRGAIATFRGL